MANIPPKVIFIWTGTHAGIPAGWVRTTALDGLFPKGAAAGANPNTTGGSDTHTHTSPVHTHAAIAHAHSGQTSRDGNYETEGGSYSGARDAHIHNWSVNDVQGGNLSDAITYQSADNKPPFYEVIFIEPNAVAKPLPNGAIGFKHDGIVPTGWHHCDGTTSTPDLRNKYLRGAGTGADAGTTGGATSHSHTVDHTHSGVTHSHIGGTDYDSDQGSTNHKNSSADGGSACDRHTHTSYLYASASETGSTYTSTAGSADTGIEPLYKKLIPIKNAAGAGSKPKQIIALFLGNVTDPTNVNYIPRGWVLCDGNNGTPDMTGYHIKCSNDTSVYDVSGNPSGEALKTGGSNTHTHAASNSHTHTAAGTHTHTGYTSYFPQDGSTGASGNGISQGHSHTINDAHGGNCSSATSSWDVATIQADASNNEPAYRTAAFIMFKRELIGGLILQQPGI